MSVRCLAPISPWVVHIVSASISNPRVMAIRLPSGQTGTSSSFPWLYIDLSMIGLLVGEHVPCDVLAGGDPGAVLLHVGDEPAKRFDPAATSDQLGVELQDEDFVAFLCNSSFQFPKTSRVVYIERTAGLLKVKNQ